MPHRPMAWAPSERQRYSVVRVVEARCPPGRWHTVRFQVSALSGSRGCARSADARDVALIFSRPATIRPGSVALG